jgi:hypothetical protein
VTALTEWREQLAAPEFGVFVRLVDFEVGGGGVVEDRVGASPEYHPTTL